MVAARVGAVLVAALTLGGCAKGDSPTGPGGGTTAQFGHVFVVTEENTDYVDAIGSSSMPYLNGLATAVRLRI